METKVTFDYSKAAKFIRENEVASFEQIANAAKDVLLSRDGQGNDFLGWIDLPVDYDKADHCTACIQCSGCRPYYCDG